MLLKAINSVVPYAQTSVGMSRRDDRHNCARPLPGG
jgi:hypothetical protein